MEIKLKMKKILKIRVFALCSVVLISIINIVYAKENTSAEKFFGLLSREQRENFDRNFEEAFLVIDKMLEEDITKYKYSLQFEKSQYKYVKSTISNIEERILVKPNIVISDIELPREPFLNITINEFNKQLLNTKNKSSIDYFINNYMKSESYQSSFISYYNYDLGEVFKIKFREENDSIIIYAMKNK